MMEYEKFPGDKKDCSYQKNLIKYSQKEKELAVKELLLRNRKGKDISDDIGVERVTLYCKNKHLGKESAVIMKPRIDLPNDIESLELG